MFKTIVCAFGLASALQASILINQPIGGFDMRTDTFDQFESYTPPNQDERGISGSVDVGNGVELAGEYGYAYVGSNDTNGGFAGVSNWRGDAEFTFASPVSAVAGRLKDVGPLYQIEYIGVTSANPVIYLPNVGDSFVAGVQLDQAYSPEFDGGKFVSIQKDSNGFFAFEIMSDKNDIRTLVIGGDGLEFDDLQFGFATADLATPEPGTLGLLFVCGFSLLVVARAKRRRA